jgi:hypothetical protein
MDWLLPHYWAAALSASGIPMPPWVRPAHAQGTCRRVRRRTAIPFSPCPRRITDAPYRSGCGHRPRPGAPTIKAS